MSPIQQTFIGSHHVSCSETVAEGIKVKLLTVLKKIRVSPPYKKVNKNTYVENMIGRWWHRDIVSVLNILQFNMYFMSSQYNFFMLIFSIKIKNIDVV